MMSVALAIHFVTAYFVCVRFGSMAPIVYTLVRIYVLAHIILTVMYTLKDFSRSQAFSYAVKVVISRKRCKIVTWPFTESATSDDLEWPSRSFTYLQAFSNVISSKVLQSLTRFRVTSHFGLLGLGQAYFWCRGAWKSRHFTFMWLRRIKSAHHCNKKLRYRRGTAQRAVS